MADMFLQPEGWGLVQDTEPGGRARLIEHSAGGVDSTKTIHLKNEVYGAQGGKEPAVATLYGVAGSSLCPGV